MSVYVTTSCGIRVARNLTPSDDSKKVAKGDQSGHPRVSIIGAALENELESAVACLAYHPHRCRSVVTVCITVENIAREIHPIGVKMRH